MLGEVPHFLLREQVGFCCFFANGKCPRQRHHTGRPIEASGNGLELGGLRSVDAWEEAHVAVAAVTSKRETAAGTTQSTCQIKDLILPKTSVFLLQLFDSSTHEIKKQAID